MVNVVTIGIAGGTGAGKTTLARKLFESLGEENVAYILHDSYYKDLSNKTPEERAANNFDHPQSLETGLLVEHLTRLKAGEPVEIPTYNFCTHTRESATVRQEPRPVILVEGILLFCDQSLVSQFDMKVFVDAPSDIRLMRRIRRDCEERDRTVDSVLRQYHSTVRPMHEAFVEPSKAHANLIVPTTGKDQSSPKEQLRIAVQVLANHVRTLANLSTS